MEHQRVHQPSLPKTLWHLTLVLCLGASACDDDLSWPSAPPEPKDRPCEGVKDPQIPGLQDPALPGVKEPQLPKTPIPKDNSPELPGASLPEGSDPELPGDQASSGSTSDEAGPQDSPNPDLPGTDSGGAPDPAPQDAMDLAIWEFLPDPERTDGLVDSPETVDLIVTGEPEQEGPVRFELSGQGWSPLTHESFPDTPSLWMRTGSLIRIERYKNKTELELAKAKFPNQVMDPKTGRLAVQILRMTGAGLRNKGGWLALRSGSSALHGVIYGEIETDKVDSQVLAEWKGPFASKAPSGQALCKIPQRPDNSQTDAAWWTACEPSSWGRPKEQAQ